MKRFLIGCLGIFIFFCWILPALADSKYLFRQKLNWVKIDKASAKEVPLGTLKHPFQVEPARMEAMLLSIKISKKHLLKNELQSADVFNSWEARKFAPYLADALSKVDGDQVVNFSVIHKRPFFILRNDHVSIANVWVSDDGIHFSFKKLFARLDGDYEASQNLDKSLRKAKTMRIGLDALPGQKLSYNGPSEIILDPQYDFESQVAAEEAEELKQEDEALKAKKGKKQKGKEAKKQDMVVKSDTDTTKRLEELNQLKAKKLINEKEYQEMRKKILSEI